MLVLGRTKGDSVMIGDDLKVAVTEIEGERILLTVSHRGSANGRTLDQDARHWMRSGDAIGVADGIVCSVILIDHGKIRLGFKCPPTVKINRTEIYNSLRK